MSGYISTDTQVQCIRCADTDKDHEYNMRKGTVYLYSSTLHTLRFFQIFSLLPLFARPKYCTPLLFNLLPLTNVPYCTQNDITPSVLARAQDHIRPDFYYSYSHSSRLFAKLITVPFHWVKCSKFIRS